MCILAPATSYDPPTVVRVCHNPPPTFCDITHCGLVILPITQSKENEGQIRAVKEKEEAEMQKGKCKIQKNGALAKQEMLTHTQTYPFTAKSPLPAPRGWLCRNNRKVPQLLNW